jgi:hypothetical protein
MKKSPKPAVYNKLPEAIREVLEYANEDELEFFLKWLENPQRHRDMIAAVRYRINLLSEANQKRLKSLQVQINKLQNQVDRLKIIEVKE